jgi:TolB protein
MSVRAALVPLLVLSGCATPPSARPPGAASHDEPALTQVTEGRSGDDQDPEVSPDGRLLLYASSAFGPDYDLFVKSIGSNTATRLTRLPGDERFPKVNPGDPNLVAFCTNSRGGWEVAVLDLAGDPERIEYVSEAGVDSLHPSWSPDGRRLVYCASDPASRGEWVLKILDRPSAKTHVLEGVDGFLPEWSPADNRIVFQRMKHRDDWLGSVWTVDLEGGIARDLTALYASDEAAAINPSWSPDGRHVVFSRFTAGGPPAGDDLWVVGADGTRPTRLTSSPSSDGMPAWGRDGRIYFVSDRRGASRIWSLRPDLP